ncbi:MAG: hypothetical protein H6873_05490 [Hyphomicrobiaceae bacterium]|nr:hypothetical protein [Hyphomicrobiaceae bacterium]
MSILKGIIRFLVGLILGVVATVLLVPAAAALFDVGNNVALAAFWIGIPLFGALLGVFASSIRRAFGRGFLLDALASFALPLSGLLLSSKVGIEQVANASATDKAAATVGSGIAGMMFTGLSTFVGIILGLIFLIIALVLLLGGNKPPQVIVIQQSAPSTTNERQEPEL